MNIRLHLPSCSPTMAVPAGQGKGEIDMIRHALYLTNGHQSFAAKLLGIKKTTLHAKLKRFDIERKHQQPVGK